jgi:hypothetical protein
MATNTSRRKGLSYENKVATKFRNAGWKDAKRHLEFQSQEAASGRDLDGTQPFAVQVKCWKKPPNISVIDEITIDKEYYIRCAILKRQITGKKPIEVACIDLQIFLEMANAVLYCVENGYLAKGTWDAIADPIMEDNSGERVEED